MSVEQMAPPASSAVDEDITEAVETPCSGPCSDPKMPSATEIREHLVTLQSELDRQIAARRATLADEIKSATEASREALNATKKSLRATCNEDIKALRKSHKQATRKWTQLAESLSSEEAPAEAPSESSEAPAESA